MIATPGELASSLQVASVDNATANLLLTLAEGLVTDEIGAQDPWPAAAKSVVLSAAGRAYANPEGLRRETVGANTGERNPEEMGVYLSDAEMVRLHRWASGPGGSTTAKPQGSFPLPRPWPDPVEAW